MCGESDSAGGLDLLAFVIQSPRNNRLGAILVGGCSLWWEHVKGIVELVVVSPIGIFTIDVKHLFMAAVADLILTWLPSTYWRSPLSLLFDFGINLDVFLGRLVVTASR